MRLLKLAALVATASLLTVLTVPTLASAAPEERTRVKVCPVTEIGPESVERLTGADRFEVAVRASQEAFPEGADVVYLASGTAFADALAGSGAAGHRDGPLLLVRRDTVSDSVLSELARLSPREVVLLGGTTSISAEVEASLDYLPATVTRVSGVDRYEVAAELKHGVFGDSNDLLYIASGEVFPDALSASAAAGDWDVPVLLSRKAGLPESTLKALRSESVLEEIIVVGGTATISDAVVAQLAEFAPVRRISAPDRYAVSAATSKDTFCELNPVVYVASGEVFPDALGGSAAAIESGAPVLLVKKDVVPGSVVEELKRLRPQQIKVLGGPNTISDSVVLQLHDYLWSAMP
jgi:putative cell wall-binding protein